MSLLQNSNAIPTGETGYTLTDSVRLRRSATAYLKRTPSGTGTNRKKYTISMWVKRSELSPPQPQALMVARTGTTAIWDMFRFDNSDDTLELWYYNGSSYSVKTAAKFRDPSAWYHFVCAVDTTQATAANRVKIYVNGTQQTLTGSYPPQNSNMNMNHTYDLYIGQQASAYYFDGYITEVNFVDGQTLAETDFGEYDNDTGVWKPKRYTGTYGTNGFYLPMSEETELYSAEYLIVAGGGGASDAGGPGAGGGAGGLLAGSTNVYSGTVYNITVGTGGAAAATAGGNAYSGTNSTALGLTAIGGGHGNVYGQTNGAGTGGSGGGGGYTISGSNGTTGQGNKGGDYLAASWDAGGGGGGKGGAGGNATYSGASTKGGVGGTGYASSITGTSLYYAGGGAGGTQDGTVGVSSGGSGVGGNGGRYPNGGSAISATAPTANTGSGGGGGYNCTDGADGVVILRVLTSNYSGTTTGSPTVTTDGSYTVIKFTSNGSYTA